MHVHGTPSRGSLSRREFLGSLAGLAATLPLAAAFRWAPGCPPGVQLYTVREALARDFEGTLARIAEIGFREVEMAGYLGRTPTQVRRALAGAGLVSPANHVGVEALGEALERTLDQAAEVGHRYLIVPWIPEAMRTLDGYRALADSLNQASERAIRAGLRFGYHNQEYDFRPIDGQLPHELLLGLTGERVVHELDVYWAHAAGTDPAAYLTRHTGRMRLLHLKDMDAGRQMVDLGRGTLDFRAILAAGRESGVHHCFVEHDTPASPLDSIRAGYDYLRQLEASR